MSPRMQPDGTAKITNVGTAENPILIATPGTTKEKMMPETNTTPDEAATMRAFAEALGVAKEDIDGFVGQWEASAQQILEAPKNELLYRLNSRVQGIDPGLPVNWPGERGLY